jgi:hypothetical protein
MELAGFNVEKQHSRQITLARPHSSAADATCVHGVLIVNKNRFVANVPETPMLNIPQNQLCVTIACRTSYVFYFLGETNHIALIKTGSYAVKTCFWSFKRIKYKTGPERPLLSS